MAHAVSAFAARSDRTPLQAFALAALLHVLIGLALWWMWLNEPPFPEPPIEITFEQVKPPDPPPPPPEPPPPQPAAQSPPPPAPPVEGLRPPADIIADKPTQVLPSGDRPKEPPAPPPPPLQEALPTPAPMPPSPEQAQPPPQPLQPTPVPQEQALAVPQPAKPQPRPAPPPPPQPRPPEHRPSPLTTAPPQRPPGGKPSDNPSPSPLVNPADAYSRARVQDNYLWQVVRKLQGYRYEAKVNASQGLTVVRVVIARDGRLLSVTIARSSGYEAFDNGVIAGVRSGSPYAPLPPEIKGDTATFDLPLVSINRR